MQKLLIGFALSLVATAASAEWVLVAEGRNGANKYFIDSIVSKATLN